MCFVHKPMQNADFGQILCRRASTKRHVTSWPTIRFSQTWYQKMRKTWKKKVMKRRVTICGGREAVADFVQGGVKLTPPQLSPGSLLKVTSDFVLVMCVRAYNLCAPPKWKFWIRPWIWIIFSKPIYCEQDIYIHMVPKNIQVTKDGRKGFMTCFTESPIPLWLLDQIWRGLHWYKNSYSSIIPYRQLRARRALLHFKDVPLRTRRGLSLYKVFGDCALLVLNGTSLKCNNAFLALNWRYVKLFLL